MTFNPRKKEEVIPQSRFLASVLVCFAGLLILGARLSYVQLIRGDEYLAIARNNQLRRVEIPAPRGIVYDRHGSVVLGNRPFFDLVLIPQYVRDYENTLKILSRLLGVSQHRLSRAIRSAQGRPSYLPVVIKKNISSQERSLIESNKLFLPGVDVQVTPKRHYNTDTTAHLVGFLGEVTAHELKKLNALNPEVPYYPGDQVGKQGLESVWERHLRGKSGYQVLKVDAFGREAGVLSRYEAQLPKKPATPGSDIQLTIDAELQAATAKAFEGKNGAVVALDPRNGEVLALLSSPYYDPRIYQGSLSREKWNALIRNPFKPLLDKTTGGEFAPGSIYKSVVGIAALEEGIITPSTKIRCPGHFELGGDTFHCHNRGGHGLIDLATAFMKSCDVYFYQIGVELGVDKIAEYAKDFFLGRRHKLNLNYERPGLIPTSQWRRTALNLPWTLGETPSVAIGQGANLMTPIQMVNLHAMIANGGKLWRPHIVKRVTNPRGETLVEVEPELLHQMKLTKTSTLAQIREILGRVVQDPEGTGGRARIPKRSVAGKTGTVQVVSLKKNRNQTDVSMKWKEHAIFTAFSPVENAEIAVVVLSENDKEGGGGVSAAPVAGKILAKYWQLKEQSTYDKMARKPKNDSEAEEL